MDPVAQRSRWLRPRAWWWVLAVLGVHFAAWAGWFVIAARHPVAEVPLAARAGP